MNEKTGDEEAVNQVVDCKGPLKGKGGSLAQWSRDVETRLAQVHQEMVQLAAESKSIEGRRFGLHVYGLRAGRQLRWRMTNSAHATWQRVEPMVAEMSQGLAQWYRQAQDVAQILNHREQVLRYELKTVQRLASSSAEGALGRVRDFRGTVGRGAGGGRPAPQARSSGPSDGASGKAARSRPKQPA